MIVIPAVKVGRINKANKEVAHNACTACSYFISQVGAFSCVAQLLERLCVFNMAFAPKGKAMFLMPPIHLTHSLSISRTNEKPVETTRTDMSAMVWYCVLAPW